MESAKYQAKNVDQFGRMSTANECDCPAEGATVDSRDAFPMPPPEPIRELFTYHAVNLDQTRRFERIRETALLLARALDECVPYGKDRATAILRLSEAVMIANRGISTNAASNRL